MSSEEGEARALTLRDLVSTLSLFNQTTFLEGCERKPMGAVGLGTLAVRVEGNFGGDVTISRFPRVQETAVLCPTQLAGLEPALVYLYCLT